jgi:hypothetical protein
MKKALFAFVSFLLAFAAHAQTQAPAKGACVMGLTKVVNNRLEFVRPVKVYRTAADKEPMTTMQAHDAYYVASLEPVFGRVKLVYVAGFDSNPKAGQPYGWVEIKDVRSLDDANCG